VGGFPDRVRYAAREDVPGWSGRAPLRGADCLSWKELGVRKGIGLVGEPGPGCAGRVVS